MSAISMTTPSWSVVTSSQILVRVGAPWLWECSTLPLAGLSTRASLSWPWLWLPPPPWECPKKELQRLLPLNFTLCMTCLH
jgi:hypothetical protein